MVQQMHVQLKIIRAAEKAASLIQLNKDCLKLAFCELYLYTIYDTGSTPVRG